MNILEEYAEQINHSPVFTMNREQEPSAYEREKNRLIEAIYQYKLEENPDNENYGLEIVETVSDCLQYFTPGETPFMHYFNASFSRRKTQSQAKNNLQEKSSGMHFTRSEIDASRAIYAFLNTHPDVSLELETLLKEYSEEIGLSEEALREAIKTYASSLVESGDAELSSEEGFTLFDMTASGTDFTESIADREHAEYLIELCDQEYVTSREGTKKFLSIKLSALFAEIDRSGDFVELVKAKHFYNQEIYEMVFISGKKLQNKEISVMLGKSEPNLTMTWQRFQKKLRNRRSGQAG